MNNGRVKINKNGTFTPVVYDKGFIEMVELQNGKWTVLECNTREEAEKCIEEYYNFNTDEEEEI